MLDLSCTKKHPTTWTSSDIADFFENVASIASDGDLATTNPALREMALSYIAGHQYERLREDGYRSEQEKQFCEEAEERGKL